MADNSYWKHSADGFIGMSKGLSVSTGVPPKKRSKMARRLSFTKFHPQNCNVSNPAGSQGNLGTLLHFAVNVL